MRLEEKFDKYYKRLEEEIQGMPAECKRKDLFKEIIAPIIKKSITLDKYIKNGVEYKPAKIKCKINNMEGFIDLDGYYFIMLTVGYNKVWERIFIGGYPVEPLNRNYRTSWGNPSVLNSLDGAPTELKQYVELIKKYNDVVHENKENNITEDPDTIANRVLNNFQTELRASIRDEKLRKISSPTQRLNTSVDEYKTWKEKAVVDKNWDKLAEIARQYYDPSNTQDEEGQYQIYRHEGEHWAVTDGTTVFANAATACKFYAEGMNLDLVTEMKKGDRLYKACENIDAKGKLSSTPVLMYGVSWRYATADEILNATDKVDAALWHR